MTPDPPNFAANFAPWQSRRHFDFAAPWEHVKFAVYSTFDVVARPGWRLSHPRQPYAELWLVREGAVEISQNGRDATATAPCVALLRTGQSRDTRQKGDAPLSILGFSFSATLWGVLDWFDFLPLPPVFPVPPPRLEPLLTQMIEESNRRARGYALALQGWGQLALVELWRAQNDSESVEWNRLKIAQNDELAAALNLVAARFGEPLEVAQMARAAHLSTKHFGRKFHAALGLTPMEYVRRVRLNHARDLLASGDGSVAQIARQCGFEDGAHFSRAFKTHWGAAPLAFRRTLRQSMHPEDTKCALKVKTGETRGFKIKA